jgi:hypothetical protein
MYILNNNIAWGIRYFYTRGCVRSGDIKVGKPAAISVAFDEYRLDDTSRADARALETMVSYRSRSRSSEPGDRGCMSAGTLSKVVPHG